MNQPQMPHARGKWTNVEGVALNAAHRDHPGGGDAECECQVVPILR